MFKCEITETLGPFCGMGGYGSVTKIGMHRSPKEAVRRAKSWSSFDGSQIVRTENENPETGICGGGVPVLLEFKLYKNNKLIKHYWD
jgi:hypothetical protein